MAHKSSVHRSPANEAARISHETTPAPTSAFAGWTGFAGVLFLLLGAFNVIAGVAALAGDAKFAENDLFFGDLTAWGMILIGFGGLQLFTSALIFRRSVMGQVGGMLLAGFNMVVHLFFIPAYPIWSVIIMIIDALVIYALTVYGDDFV